MPDRVAAVAGHLVVGDDLLGAGGELERASAVVERLVVPAERGLDVALVDVADAVVHGHGGVGRGGEGERGGDRGDDREAEEGLAHGGSLSSCVVAGFRPAAANEGRLWLEDQSASRCSREVVRRASIGLH